MTKQTIYSKFKTFAIFLLTALMVFCTYAFFVACNEKTEEKTETKYSYSETDTDTISNAFFAYGTYNKDEDDFPITSPTGWTRASDNSATASNVNSGVVSTAPEAWKELFTTLYSDSDFSAYFSYKFKADATEAIRTGKGDSSYTPSSDDLKSYYKDHYFVNPGARPDAEDAYIYMLNNYATSFYNMNSTAQRIRSSSTVSVNKGEIYKVSVWVKTLNITGNGANIRFTNAVNGTTQAEFRLSGINDTEWTKYTVYFVANDDYNCTFSIMLGLGYGNGDANDTSFYSEGTVFFDDVTVEKIDELPATGIVATEVLNFLSDEVAEIKIGTENTASAFVYDMNYVLNGYTFNAIDANASVTGTLTVSNVNGGVTSETLTGKTDTVTLTSDAEEVTANLTDNASYTLTVKDGANNFKVAPESYALLSFKIKNQLNELGSTDVTVDLFDINGDTVEKRAGIATFSDVSDDFVICNLIVNNNFKYGDREFYIQIVVGPTDIASVKSASEFAKGSVTVKDIKLAGGFISADKYTDKANDTEYKIYSDFASSANATTALYAGYNADYSESSSNKTYALTPAQGSISRIISAPAAVSGYNGIVANHIYITGTAEDGSDLATAVNDRLDFSSEGFAGLINTAYLNDYSYAGKSDLETLLDGLHDENDIQPIIIYNNYGSSLSNHYGFVGEAKTVSASAYAKVTVKLKVDDTATAYVYLVDVSKDAKEVLTFADFTVNTDIISGLNGKSYKAEDHKFVIKVDKNSEVKADGWTEVNFYLAAGANAKNFRVEVWNGGRNGATDTASKGYVAVNSISVTTSSAFTEPTTWSAAATSSSNPLFNMFVNLNDIPEGEELIAYTRELTDTEKAFNKEYPADAVAYNPNYIWANNGTSIYAIFNTVDPVVSDPYANIDKEETGSGCNATADPSTFWLSFSSIVLAVVLILAIIALFVKNIRKKRKAAKSDVKAQYKVKSRTETQKAIRKSQAKAEKTEKEESADEPEEEVTAEEVTPEEPAEESVSDAPADENAEDKTTIETDYVYGDVQDFGDMTLENPEEKKDDKTE